MTALQRHWMTLDEFLDWDPPDPHGGAWDLLDGEPMMQANPSETHGALQTALGAAILLVEILSPGNRQRTRDSVTILAGLPSVQEIVLVDSERVSIEVRRRGPDGAWSDADERHGPGGRLVLATIGLDVAVDEIYAGLGFD